jgi:hypothetical protein
MTRITATSILPRLLTVELMLSRLVLVPMLFLLLLDVAVRQPRPQPRSNPRPQRHRTSPRPQRPPPSQRPPPQARPLPRQLQEQLPCQLTLQQPPQLLIPHHTPPETELSPQSALPPCTRIPLVRSQPRPSASTPHTILEPRPHLEAQAPGTRLHRHHLGLPYPLPSQVALAR